MRDSGKADTEATRTYVRSRLLKEFFLPTKLCIRATLRHVGWTRWVILQYRGHVVTQYLFTAHSSGSSTMAELDDSVFSSVLSAFRLRLTPQDINDFQSTTLEDLKEEITKIQRTQAQRRGFRNLAKIRPFLNGIEQYSKVIEVFVNVKPAIMAFIWVRNFQRENTFYC